ncbi:STAS/SEC14 domain-containing protein [Mycobacterium spongiae]|uniref:STAS/SEC14 domain-containing protein n=2 Tax=Mycobacterium spongiae TaxID=886343 RepID=A0A975PZ22_9MYCO|nr:STAS/SEC14 domain-containing protein [Mycobacterium spongiae]
MIEALTGFPDNVAAFACHGHVTKDDYETVLIPDIEERLNRHKKVRIYYEVGPDFDGVGPGAVWDDAKLGFSHLMSWERFAVVTDVDWMARSIKLFGFLMPAKLRTFSTADAGEAREWIGQTQE